MHKLTTHLSTRAIPQLPHKVMPTVILLQIGIDTKDKQTNISKQIQVQNTDAKT